MSFYASQEFKIAQYLFPLSLISSMRGAANQLKVGSDVCSLFLQSILGSAGFTEVLACPRIQLETGKAALVVFVQLRLLVSQGIDFLL